MSLSKDKSKSILDQWAARKKDQTEEQSNNQSFAQTFSASEGQQRLFFIQKLDPEIQTYNLVELWRFNGPLDESVFIEAINKVGERQDILRARFTLSDDQIICDTSSSFKWTYEIHDLSIDINKENKAHELAKDISQRAFNLETGPLLIACICKMALDDFLVIINIHHIISDKWSMRIFRKEISEQYKYLTKESSTPISPLKAQFSSYVSKQKEKQNKTESLAYWTKKLTEPIEKTTLPYTETPSSKPSKIGKYATRKLSQGHSVLVFCKQQKITPFVYFLSLFKILISKYTQQTDLIIGTPISTRFNADFEQIIGFFNDTLLLRNTVNQHKTAIQFFQEVNVTTLEAFEHKDIGFHNIITKLNPDRAEQNPLFQMMFLFHKKVVEEPFSKNLHLSVQNFDMGVSKFDFTLYIEESEHNFEATIEYATDRYDESYVLRFLGHLDTLSSQVLTHPESAINQLHYLTEQEQSTIIELGKGNPLAISKNQLIIDLINEHNHSSDIALQDEKRAISYADLAIRSNRIANTILELGCKKATVGIFLGQSIDFVASMIGVLKAGCTYVPLDISYPKKHIQHAIEAANISYLIYESETKISNVNNVTRVYLNELSTNSKDPNVFIHPNDPAYIIFTSGSTGKPNGVVITHENLLVSTKARFAYYDTHPSAFLLCSSFSFDSSVAGIYWTLVNGGKLVIAPKKAIQDVETVSAYINREAISHTLLIPSLYKVYLDHIPGEILSQLKVVILAGEALPVSLANKHLKCLPTVRLYNEYGPTEASVWISAYEITGECELEKIPIGKSIINNQLFILDEYLQLVPRGIAGELYIAGESVALGYLSQTESNSRKFINAKIKGEEYRLYKTGDWVQWDNNNNLLFLGRRDHQIKVRGYRIELDEVDHIIQNYKAGIQSKTIYKSNSKQLLSFICSDKEEDISAIKEHVCNHLPKQYWPDNYRQLSSFPLMPNGKIDIKALEDNIGIEPNEIKVQGPNNESAKILLNIWRDILQNPSLSTQDNFFASGGDSIQIIRVIAKARKEGLMLSVNDIYQHQTIDKLFANSLEFKPDEVVQNIIWDYVPLSPIQSWFFEHHQSAPDHWHLGIEITLGISIGKEEGKQIVKKLVDAYEILNTKIERFYNRYFIKRTQFDIDHFIHFDPSSPVDYTTISITEGPLIRFYFFTKDEKFHKIQIVAHHLIMDAVSWHLLIQHLDSLLSNPKRQLIKKKFEYYNWVHHLQRLASTNVFDLSVPYWASLSEVSSSYFAGKTKAVEKTTQTITTALDKATSTTLRMQALHVADIKIHELIICAFLRSFNTISQESECIINIERHGRDIEFIDISESIGWHTNYFPVHFTVSPDDTLLNSLINVKDQLRAVPDSGLSYGVLKYLSNKLPDHISSYVTINHLGDSFDISSENIAEVTVLTDGMRAANANRDTLIEINSIINKGQLEINMRFDSIQFDKEEMTACLMTMQSQLEALSMDLEGSSKYYSPSDFNFLFTEKDIDILTKSQSISEDILSINTLTATQNAFLFHHVNDSEKDQGLITAFANIEGALDLATLRVAWQKTVQKYDALRSYYVWENVSTPAQITLSKVKSSLRYLGNEESQRNGKNVEEWLAEQKSQFRLDKGPTHNILCVQKNKQSYTIVFLCHHINLDGWSTSILLNELISAYRSICTNSSFSMETMSLSDWSNAYSKEAKKTSLNLYWHKEMKALQPCILKSEITPRQAHFESISESLDINISANLRTFAQQKQISLTSIFAGVWSYLLTKYTDRDAIFGITFSGRSLLVPNIDKAVGMFSNVLPFVTKKEVANKLNFTAISKKLTELLSNDAVSIDDIENTSLQHVSALYNTLLVVENFFLSDKKASPYVASFSSDLISLMPLCVVFIPDDTVKIQLRYESQLFSKDEIHKIMKDITCTLSQLLENEDALGLSYQPFYSNEQQGEHKSQVISHKIEHSSIMYEGTLEQKLLQIWSAYLPTQTLSITDDFFDVGGTSLIAVRIFNALHKQANINASPILLLKNRTVEKLASALNTENASKSWQSVYPLKEAGKYPPLFCFHSGDGHIMFYNDLASNMNVDRPVYGIQPMGLDGKDINFDSIEDMANFYITEIKKQFPKGPYHVLGTCFSNAVTFEIAKKLKHEIGEVFIIDSPPPYYNELSKLSKWMHWLITFNIPKLWEAFSSLFKYVGFRKPQDKQAAHLFNTAKHLRKIMSNYSWLPQDVQVTLIRSSQNDTDPYKAYHFINWQKLSKKGLQIRTISGEHTSIFEGDSALEMAQVVHELMAKNES